MSEAPENLLIAVSDTGPLISIFQSDSLELVATLFGQIHISETCEVELVNHGWAGAITRAGVTIISHKLTGSEAAQAGDIARRIAAHPSSKNPEPDVHRGEAEVMVLVQRPEFADSVLLLDELTARAVAMELNLWVSGFAGVLLLAVDEALLTADDVKQRLKRCQQQGTHYSSAFIERIYQAAKEGES